VRQRNYEWVWLTRMMAANTVVWLFNHAVAIEHLHTRLLHILPHAVS